MRPIHFFVAFVFFVVSSFHLLRSIAKPRREGFCHLGRVLAGQRAFRRRKWCFRKWGATGRNGRAAVGMRKDYA